MQYELTCAECNVSFSSAALMLQHFAQHASQNSAEPKESELQSSLNAKKATIPDLYPISSFKAALRQSKLSKCETFTEDNEENIDSGVEDMNPLRYCAVSIEDIPLEASPDDNEYVASHRSKCAPRKYECTYCWKTFGWSTDLKRHILTHTGERPFKCSLCDSTFTRKFLLQKHQAKQHSNLGYGGANSDDKIKIPPLKPLGLLLKQKSRKQDKQKIRRKVLNAKHLYQSLNDHFEVADNLICST